MTPTPSETERLRQEFNVAVANGLMLRARQIARRLDALTPAPAGDSGGERG